MDENAKNCYLGINGKKHGPMSEQDIRALYSNKKITGDALFIRVGMKEWIPLSKSGVISSTADDDGLPPLSSDQNQSKSKIGIPILVNGIIALIFGAIGMRIVHQTTTYGIVASMDRNYANAAAASYDAADRLAFLTGFGVILLIISIITLVLKRKMSSSILKICLWFVPMTITIVFVVINYIPILNLVYWQF